MSDERENHVPPPYPLAMVVCDAVAMDAATGKKYLHGTFSAITSSKYPHLHGAMCLYLALTNGRGQIPVRVVLVDVNEERPPLVDTTVELPFDDPRVVIEAVIPIVRLRIPEAGEYRFQLFAGSDFLMERRILAIKLEAPDADLD